MSGDKLVFDLATQAEAPEVIFTKKDWVSLMDNQNGQYGNNQSVVDTSQVSNGDKFINYQEAYLTVPMVLTVTSSPDTDALPAQIGADYAFGLKNWFGQIIHSITVDYNSTNIIQQTPYVNFWNHFKLMTTLSWQEVLSEGPTIGFYPDESLSFQYFAGGATNALPGRGVCNNSNTLVSIGGPVSADYTSPNTLKAGGGNYGFLKRQTYINYNPNGAVGVGAGTTPLTYANLQTTTSASQLWKSYVFRTIDSNTTGAVPGVWQVAINAVIYLKHLHSFFEMIPLVKGAFMNITMLLNNTSVTITNEDNPNTTTTLTSVRSAYGGTCPFMMASRDTFNGGVVLKDGTIHMNLSVGSRCLDNEIAGTIGVIESPLGQKSVFLHVPAYTFNPVYYELYIKQNVKKVYYTDIYHYPVRNVPANGNFNQLITNGIADLKSILIVPFITSGQNGFNFDQYSSPFDTAPATTAPLVQFSNFNVQVSGSNMLYNMQQYSFEEFCNQLRGARSVNGGLTDGLASGLINYQDFQTLYCYYYVDLSRMSPEDKLIARSVQIQGINRSNLNVDLHVFIEYGKNMEIDVELGKRIS